MWKLCLVVREFIETPRGWKLSYQSQPQNNKGESVTLLTFFEILKKSL